MEHSFAINNHAAERYLLGELNETERDAYEEHFFCCRHCAEEIKSASEFMENARQVIQNEMRAESYSRAARRSTWKDWFNFKSTWQPIPMAACLLLLALAGLTGYQNTVIIPRLARNADQPRAELAAQLVVPKTVVLAESRDEAKSWIMQKNQDLILQFDIVDSGFETYQAEVTDASNVVKRSMAIPKGDVADPVHFVVPAGLLKSGKYFVVIRGVKNRDNKSVVDGELARIAFQLNVQD